MHYMTGYFLYARKSTDVEDKQVQSIGDQLAVLRALASEEGLTIAAEFVEKQSAKMPDRPVFNEMLNRIKNGEADGILCWKLDRLARNPVDAASVQWLLQQGIIKHIRTNDRSYYPSDNVLMIGFEFGIANQYIRDLSENTSRGLHQKAKRGEYPGLAPIGYINDSRSKTIIVDERMAVVVRQAFELYAENGSRFEDIGRFLFDNGIMTKARKRWIGGRPFPKDKVKYFLTNIFYIGMFRYAGEIYEGKHAPIIEKRLFDKVQEVLKLRGRIQKAKKEPTALCRFLQCGACGCSITCEVINKHQKNGNKHRYVYYRCTKKRGACFEPYIREEKLITKLSNLLLDFAMPKEWAEEMLLMAEKDAKEKQRVASASVQGLRTKIAGLTTGIDRLTDLYVGQDIERETYLERKYGLMSERKSAGEQIARLERNTAAWLQPLKNWIIEAKTLCKTSNSGTLDSKKIALRKISGSNLFFKNSEIVFTPIFPYAALLTARKNFSVLKQKSPRLKEVLCVVRRRGLEPPRGDPTSTSSWRVYHSAICA